MKDGMRKARLIASRCLLCSDPACTKACNSGIDCGRILRALYFKNEDGALRLMPEKIGCTNCSGKCMNECVRGKIDNAVDIIGCLESLSETEKEIPDTKDVSLETDFCGFHLENPFLLSSSVVGSNYEMVAKAFDMGWGGVCFKTVCKFIPDEVSPRFSTLTKEDTRMIGFKNAEQTSTHTLEENLEFFRELKRDYPSKLLIASIMGQDEEEWEYLARVCDESGADILELNFSCPQMVGENLGSDVGTNVELVKKFTAAVRRGTKKPILAKMTPNITDMTVPARAALESGADGIALINTVKSIMNIDLNSFISEPKVDGKSCVSGYSGKAVKPIALRFTADLEKDPEISGKPISAMGGIENYIDAAEFMSLGAGTIQVTTAVMEYGYRIVEDMIEGMKDYLAKAGMKSINELIGKALPQIVSSDELNRSTIEFPKFDRETCISCGRCVISCFDGGHQALVLDEKTKKPIMNPKKCVGCQLCMLVCPANSISPGKRVDKASLKAG